MANCSFHNINSLSDDSAEESTSFELPELNKTQDYVYVRNSTFSTIAYREKIRKIKLNKS